MLFHMNNNTFIHQVDEKNNDISLFGFIGILLVVIIVGVGIGFGISKLKESGSSSTTTGSQIKTDKTVGIVDKKTFKDSAEGILKEGGIDGEGNFHIERPGGVSQNIYVTSSTVDLAQFVGKKVKIYGQTFKGQKAGWLMDVGLVEIQ